ncbi:MAG: argininosuccinate lyase [Candidatus Saelkia tenebricola]|nr:argininosuccinate lyase [Candidatus Saelkia tenebricola]
MKEKLWGGRFKEALDSLVFDFTKSIEYDWFLFEYEAYSNIAWVEELNRLKLITSSEAKKLVKSIKELLEDYFKGKAKIDFKEEDIHSLFYKLLRKKAGDLTDKIHAGKSRNEQVVTVMRMFLKDALLETGELVKNLQKSMLKKAMIYAGVVIPGFTHLQYAQPVLFAHWMLSFVTQLERDKQRLNDCFTRVDILPLGSGALSGSNFNIDRERIKQDLSFASIGSNSMDMVSDRDFILEYLNCNLMLLLHLSRMAEDLIIYNSPGYGFIDFGDKVTTGSSLMPHKKNPDPVELIRSSVAEALSSYTFLTNVLKGLPTTYNRDLQLDKKPLFASYLLTIRVLDVARIVISQMFVNKKRASELLCDERFYLTDISEELIKQGLSWKEAHTKVGELIKYAESNHQAINKLDKSVIKNILSRDIKINEYLNADKSVNRKLTTGSTNKKYVGREIKKWQRILES